MNVPLLDLQKQYLSLKPDLDAAMIRVAESQICILGSEVEAFEQAMASYCGSRFALGVSSGTDALLMALMAIGLGTGDEVIVPTFSFFATAGAVARLGATPVFVDSEVQSFNINPELLEQRITPRTKAIIPVHLFGQCADMQAIMQIAMQHGIPVIEDAAQAIGAEYVGAAYSNGSKAGSMGLIGCFSFYPTKNLGAFGDAGLITTNDEELYVKLKCLRNHGMEPRYYHKFVGGNFRMDAIQAAVLNVKLNSLEAWHEARRRNAELYTRLFIEKDLTQSVKDSEGGTCNSCLLNTSNTSIILPSEIYTNQNITNHHIYHQYTIRVPHRDRLRSYLAERGVGAEIYYPVPLHRQECFAHLASNNAASNDADFAVANCLANHVLSLPIYPELAPKQIHYVVEMIAEFYSTIA
jgi:dTDP-4-amino-4,6-dideoxygalactose transaminase